MFPEFRSLNGLSLNYSLVAFVDVCDGFQRKFGKQDSDVYLLIYPIIKAFILDKEQASLDIVRNGAHTKP